MLFMGSEKYPTENEYDDYIQKNAGSSNAFTELVRKFMKVRVEDSFDLDGIRTPYKHSL